MLSDDGVSCTIEVRELAAKEIVVQSDIQDIVTACPQMSFADALDERLDRILRLRMLDQVRLRDVGVVFEQASGRVCVHHCEELDWLAHPLQLQRHLERDQSA